jgi:VWFA-related protein
MPAGTLARARCTSLLLLLLLAVSILLFLGMTLWAQDCPECSASADRRTDDGTWVFKKEVNEVNVLFTARHRGKLIADLSRDEVTVLDDEKQPASITRFLTQHDLPLRVGLVVDTSGSVQHRFRFEQAAAIAFLRQVIAGSDNLAFVMGFAASPRLMQDFTNDADLLARGVESLSWSDGTAIFDAVRSASFKLSNRAEAGPVARILVVLSDGEDNASRISLQEAIDTAQQTEVVIYTIGTNPPPSGSLDYNRTNYHKAGDDRLKALAMQTGGQAMFPTGAREVSRVFSRLRDDLSCRYAISYQPANFVPDGHFRKIKITARKRGKKLSVNARPGYYADARMAALASNNY